MHTSPNLVDEFFKLANIKNCTQDHVTRAPHAVKKAPTYFIAVLLRRRLHKLCRESMGAKGQNLFCVCVLVLGFWQRGAALVPFSRGVILPARESEPSMLHIDTGRILMSELSERELRLEQGEGVKLQPQAPLGYKRHRDHKAEFIPQHLYSSQDFLWYLQ